MLVRDAISSSKKKWEDDERNPFMCGCEYEIEHILDFNGTVLDDLGIIITDDHSLRNNGREFISPICNTDKQITIFQALVDNVITGKDRFSDRTSIHVHVNVRSLSLNSLKEFLLLYALVEPLFFKYVGKTRENSIYCVPLGATYLPNLYGESIEKILKNWHKYTALNLLPVIGGDGSKKLGSVEFRHMYGTVLESEFIPFLSAIESLFYRISTAPSGWKVTEYLLDFDKTIQLVRETVPTLIGNLSNTELGALLKNSIIDVKLSGIS